jgi:hypothetical protein
MVSRALPYRVHPDFVPQTDTVALHCMPKPREKMIPQDPGLLAFRASCKEVDVCRIQDGGFSS